MDCVLGLDIGTTSTIGILLDLPERVLAMPSRPVDLQTAIGPFETCTGE